MGMILGFRVMIWAQITVCITFSCLFTSIQCGAFNVRSLTPPYSTPHPMVGLCNASCTTNGSFPCIYTPFYAVSFSDDGHWSWNARFANDSAGIEIGVGLMLGPPDSEYLLSGEGYWKSRWYGGTQILSELHKTIRCSCYYVRGYGKGGSWTFHNYVVKEKKKVFDKSIEEICLPWSDCPYNENQARAMYGNAIKEKFQGWCKNT